MYIVIFAITDTGEGIVFILQRPMVENISKPTDNKELQEEFTQLLNNKKEE